MDKHPYVLASFDWSTGSLVLRMVGKTFYGGITPHEDVTNCAQAYRWASRQAARQYLRRSDHLGTAWHVLDLRRVHAPWR